MEIPNWIHSHFDESAHERVTEAITQAEMQTSAEIVPAIVASSGRYPSVFWILLFGILAFLEAALLEGILLEMVESHWWWHGVLAFVSAVLAYFLARSGWVVRLVASKEEMAHAAWMRAQVEFYEHRMHQTEGATGVLIFLSLWEHQAVVLADKNISERFPAETWEHVVSKLIHGIRKEDLAGGVRDAVLECGRTLAVQFPRQAADVDELPNLLIIKE